MLTARVSAASSFAPSGSSQCEPSGRVAATFARCTQRSAVPPTPTPTMVGGQVLPPASSTQSTTKVLIASTPSAGTAMRNQELFSEPEPFGTISMASAASALKSTLMTGTPRPQLLRSFWRVIGCTTDERSGGARVARSQPRRIASLSARPPTPTPRPVHTVENGVPAFWQGRESADSANGRLRSLLLARHAERAQPAGADVRDRRRHVGEREADLAAHQPDHRRRFAFVGHRGRLDLRLVEKILRREMRLRADAGMAERQLAGV